MIHLFQEIKAIGERAYQLKVIKQNVSQTVKQTVKQISILIITQTQIQTPIQKLINLNSLMLGK